MGGEVGGDTHVSENLVYPHGVLIIELFSTPLNKLVAELGNCLKVKIFPARNIDFKGVKRRSSAIYLNVTTIAGANI